MTDSNLVALNSKSKESTFDVTVRTLSAIKVNGLSPSEKLLLETLKNSVLDERGGISDVVIFWTDNDGHRYSKEVDKPQRKFEK